MYTMALRGNLIPSVQTIHKKIPFSFTRELGCMFSKCINKLSILRFKKYGKRKFNNIPEQNHSFKLYYASLNC